MGADLAYPEHEKLAVQQVQVDALVEFLDEWIGQKQVALCELVDSGKRTGFGSEIVREYIPVFDAKRLVFEFFDVDLDKIETERRSMLDALQTQRDG